MLGRKQVYEISAERSVRKYCKTLYTRILRSLYKCVQYVKWNKIDIFPSRKMRLCYILYLIETKTVDFHFQVNSLVRHKNIIISLVRRRRIPAVRLRGT